MTGIYMITFGDDKDAHFYIGQSVDIELGVLFTERGDINAPRTIRRPSLRSRTDG